MRDSAAISVALGALQLALLLMKAFESRLSILIRPIVASIRARKGAATSSAGGAGGVRSPSSLLLPLPTGSKRELSTRAAFPKHVILTNDDGPESDFFDAWTKLLSDYGISHTVVIPDSQFSFVAKGLSRGPVTVKRTANNAYLVDGSPATCVNLALNHLLPNTPRSDILIISGPNIGHNSGVSSVLSSGTIGAALEGALLGTRSVAVSFPFFNGFNKWTHDEVRATCDAALVVVKDLLAQWPAEGSNADAPSAHSTEVIYNINVPLGSTISTPVERTCLERGAGARYTSLYGTSEPDKGPKGSTTGAWESAALAQGSSEFAARSTAGGLGPTVTQSADYASWRASQKEQRRVAQAQAQSGAGPGAAGGNEGLAALVPVTGPGHFSEVFVWKPTGVRAFDSADVAPGTDVEAVRRMVVSVTEMTLGGAISP